MTKMQIDHIALLDDSARRLIHAANDVELLFSLAKENRSKLIGEAFIARADEISSEAKNSLWDANHNLWASDDKAKWQDLRRQAETLTADLKSPQTLGTNQSANESFSQKLKSFQSNLETIDADQRQQWNGQFDKWLKLDISQRSLMLIMCAIQVAICWLVRKQAKTS